MQVCPQFPLHSQELSLLQDYFSQSPPLPTYVLAFTARCCYSLSPPFLLYFSAVLDQWTSRCGSTFWLSIARALVTMQMPGLPSQACWVRLSSGVDQKSILETRTLCDCDAQGDVRIPVSDAPCCPAHLEQQPSRATARLRVAHRLLVEGNRTHSWSEASDRPRPPASTSHRAAGLDSVTTARASF